MESNQGQVVVEEQAVSQHNVTQNASELLIATLVDGTKDAVPVLRDNITPSKLHLNHLHRKQHKQHLQQAITQPSRSPRPQPTTPPLTQPAHQHIQYLIHCWIPNTVYGKGLRSLSQN